MFSILYCLLPVILIPITILLSKNRESLMWYIRKGKICYNCKENLNLSDEDLMSRVMIDNNFSNICTQCSRDIKISSISNPLISIKYKFHKFLISKKFDRLAWYFGGFAFFFIIADVVFMSFGHKLSLFWIYGTINILSWFINIYKIYYTTKKPSE
jgi:hypothetical protein